MSNRRVILITPGFTADETDRNCLPTLQLFVEELLRQGMAVDVVALDYPFSNRPFLWKGADVYPCDGGNRRWMKPRTCARAVSRCLQLIEAAGNAGEKPVLHSFWLGWASAVGEWVSRRSGVRHLTTLMGQDVLPPNRHWYRFLRADRADRLVALSEYQNRIFEQNAGVRAGRVIPFGVSDLEIPPVPEQQRPVDILGAGSLIRLKNWDLWLQAVAPVLRNEPWRRTLILGDGPERRRLQALAERLEIGSQIEFAGELPRPQVLERMNLSRVFLHTSTYESQGYVLCEAAMCGCRVLSTPVGVAPDMAHVAEKAGDLTDLLVAALENSAAHQTVTPYLMRDTVQAYHRLYFQEAIKPPMSDKVTIQ